MDFVSNARENATRHLLLIQDVASIDKQQITECKHGNVDVIYMTSDYTKLIEDQIKKNGSYWKSVNLICHAGVSESSQTITMFNNEMSVNKDLLDNDPNTQGLRNLLILLSGYTHSIYIFSCNLGSLDGFKKMCIDVDTQCKIRDGIFIKSDKTGNPIWIDTSISIPNGVAPHLYTQRNVGGDGWTVDWGTQQGYMENNSSFVNYTNHAQTNLFRNISELTFILDEQLEIGQKIYERAFGRGCGTCHDIPSNPQLSANIKAGTLTRLKFEAVLTSGKGGMPKAIAEIMKNTAVLKAGYTVEMAIDALYKYISSK